MVITTGSEKETIKAGEEISRRLKPGDMVALSGALGAGKTTLVKGIAKGLGVRDYLHVNSPSFTLVKEYKGRIPLFHFDVYRLNSLKDIEDIGYEDYLARNGIVVIEWSNKMDRILPVRHLAIALRIQGQGKRSLTIKEIRP